MEIGFLEDCPGVERRLGAMLTSVFVVRRRAFPCDCGSSETKREDVNTQIRFLGIITLKHCR